MSELLVCKTKIGDKEYELFESPESNPEIFAEAVQGIAVRGTTVRVNFTRDIIDYNAPNEGAQKRAIACRLVMPLPNYIEVIEYLHKNVQEMKGLIEAKPEQEQKPS